MRTVKHLPITKYTLKREICSFYNDNTSTLRYKWHKDIDEETKTRTSS